MPKEFSVELKQLAFSIIDFVEKEKHGPSISFNNVTDRLQTMLGISQRSVYWLKYEIKELKEEQERLVGCARSSSFSLSLIALSPVSRSGRPKVQLTILEEDTIRLIFHQLLKYKVYPTVETLLSTLLDQNSQFLIQSKTSLRPKMKELDFKYRETKKSKSFNGFNSFSSATCCLLSKRLINYDQVNTFCNYYHDETWLNKNEEKTAVWFDDKGYDPLRSSEGKDVE